MAALSTQNIGFPSAVGPVFGAAAGGGDTLKAGDRTRLLVKNGGGSSINVTIPVYPATLSHGAAMPALVVAVPAAGERWIGPLSASQFRNPATDNVEVAYSGVTTVTVAVIAD